MRGIALALVVFAPTPARAWDVLTSDPETCGAANALHWIRIPVPVWVAEAGTTDLPIEDAEAAILAGFAHWERPELSHAAFEPRGRLEIDLQVTSGGFAEHRWDPFRVPRNVVAFQDEGWPDELHGARAVTYALFHTCDGEILQTDIVLNDTYTDWYAGSPPAGCDSCFDLENIVTHEVGHLLGLAHTDVPGATMNICDRPGAEPADCQCVRSGETCARSLEEDDLAGAAFLYPPGQAPARPTYAGGVGDPCRQQRAEVMARFERAYLMGLLERHDRKFSRAASAAGIDRSYFKRLIRKYRD